METAFCLDQVVGLFDIAFMIFHLEPLGYVGTPNEHPLQTPLYKPCVCGPCFMFREKSCSPKN
jgi:hypothetical protein